MDDKISSSVLYSFFFIIQGLPDIFKGGGQRIICELSVLGGLEWSLVAAGGVGRRRFFFFFFTLFPPIFCTIACSVGKPVLGPHEGNEDESVGL